MPMKKFKQFAGSFLFSYPFSEAHLISPTSFKKKVSFWLLSVRVTVNGHRMNVSGKEGSETEVSAFFLGAEHCFYLVDFKSLTVHYQNTSYLSLGQADMV